MAHSFEVDIAEKYGVNAAILLNNIYFWCQKNKANKHNFFDGSYWTYNSRSAFTEIFPYFSERQIKTALDKLIADGVIKTGCYNKDPRDRSLWYSLTDKGWCMMQKCSEQNTEMSNANSEDVRALPDSKTTDGKPDSKPDISISSVDDGFDDFWKVYPRHPNKQDAIKAWKALKPSKETIEAILRDIPKKLGENGLWANREKDKIPYPATYLRGRQWEDEDDGSVQPKSAESWWKSRPWWEWPIEEQRKLEEKLENGG